MKSRSREGLAWGLSMALASVVFVLWPQWDMQAAALFYAAHAFPADRWWMVQAVYVLAPRLGQVAFVLALLMLAGRLWLQPWVARWMQRRALAWVLVVLLGVGLVVHEGLKNQVGRPRPVQVTAFGGASPFVPVFVVSQACQRNCSFVSGHAAIGFSLMAWGMWAAPVRRRRWFWTAMTAGALVGLVRMAQGGHFLSDIVFSGLAIWGSTLSIRWGWLYGRLRRQRKLLSRA